MFPQSICITDLSTIIPDRNMHINQANEYRPIRPLQFWNKGKPTLLKIKGQLPAFSQQV